MKIAIDLDNTLLKTNGRDYRNSTPIEEAIKKVNKLYSDGHHITIFTARGQSSRVDWTLTTKKQLEKFNIPYHDLIVGDKPSFDLLIDDKAVNAIDWINDDTIVNNFVNDNNEKEYKSFKPFTSEERI